MKILKKLILKSKIKTLLEKLNWFVKKFLQLFNIKIFSYKEYLQLINDINSLQTRVTKINDNLKTNEENIAKISGNYQKDKGELARISGDYQKNKEELARISGDYQKDKEELARISGDYQKDKEELARIEKKSDFVQNQINLSNNSHNGNFKNLSKIVSNIHSNSIVNTNNIFKLRESISFDKIKKKIIKLDTLTSELIIDFDSRNCPSKSVDEIEKELDLLFNTGVDPIESSFFSESLKKDISIISNKAPKLIEVWKRLFFTNLKEYLLQKPSSLSNSENEIALQFAQFINLDYGDLVLDIGSGPLICPSYLENKIDDIYYVGLDPIPFRFQNNKNYSQVYSLNGISEYLPLINECVDKVICATSLDHVLILDKTFSEINRVLKKNGIFFSWVFFVEGSPKYMPLDPSFDTKPIDDFHLFHLDKKWYEEEVNKFFETIFVRDIILGSDYLNYSGSFYIHRKK